MTKSGASALLLLLLFFGPFVLVMVELLDEEGASADGSSAPALLSSVFLIKEL